LVAIDTVQQQRKERIYGHELQARHFDYYDNYLSTATAAAAAAAASDSILYDYDTLHEAFTSSLPLSLPTSLPPFFPSK
jgi:hypothetical protein